MAQYLSTSRFIKTPLIMSRSGKSTYGVVQGFDRLKNIKGNEYNALLVDGTNRGRPDLIALDAYGDSHLGWVIVFANKPKNPLNWPEVGEVIKVPTRSFVRGLY